MSSRKVLVLVFVLGLHVIVLILGPQVLVLVLEPQVLVNITAVTVTPSFLPSFRGNNIIKA